GGSCSSSSNDNKSVVGDNTITFNAMADGTYDNCTISVTDNTSNTSDNLTVSEFTIGAIKPVLVQVTAAVPNPTNDNTPSYTFFSTLSGRIGYGVICTSDNVTAVAMDNNTITFNALAEGTYDNCTISVTSNNVVSDNLSVDNFTIDTITPTLNQVTPVSTPYKDSTPNYTFSPNETGTITYGGSCSSTTTSALADNNTITFNALADGTYDNCTISVTDNTSNTSDNLSVSSFTIDTI
ncbi:uncharacterized protein METZ01_LOCUS491040, partial [marine metagenome]